MKRRWLLWLLTIVLLGVVIARLTDIRELLQTLARGRWAWVLAAFALQGVYYLVLTDVYRSAFNAVGVERDFLKLLPVMFASLFVNVIAPVAGVGGAALFVDDAARRGHSGSRVAAGTLLALAADFSAFIVLLFASLCYLLLRKRLYAYEILGAAIVLAVTCGMVGLLSLGLWSRDYLLRLFEGLQTAVNWIAARLGRPKFLDKGWAEEHAADFIRAAQAVATHPRKLARTLSAGLTSHLVNLACFWALTMAFHKPVALGVLAAGYAMSITFRIASITPQGVGVAEGITVLVYASLGVPRAQAAAITLAFRGMFIWAPTFVGFILMRRMRLFAEEDADNTEAWQEKAANEKTG